MSKSDCEESNDDVKLISERNWNRMKVSLQQEGLREGAASGRDKAFQKGFDKGFSEGFKAAYALGYLKSLTTTLKQSELGIPPKTNIEEAPLAKPERGLCQICPDVDSIANKLEMSKKIENFLVLPVEDIVSQQRKIVKEVVDVTKQKLLNQLDSIDIHVDVSDLYD